MDDKSILMLLNFSLDNAPLAIYWVDAYGVIKRANLTACKMLGYSQKEMIGMKVPQINPEFSLKSLKQHIFDLKDNKIAQFESLQITKTGEELPVLITSYAVNIEGEQYNCTYIEPIKSGIRSNQKSTGQNIIGQNQQTLEANFLNIFNYSNDAIFVGDPNQNSIVDVNPKACKLLGYTKEELLRIGITEIIPRQDKDLRDFFNSVRSKKSAETDKLVLKSKTGHRIFAEISASIFSINNQDNILTIVHTESDEGKFERVIGQVTEASIVNSERSIIQNFISETARVLKVKYAGLSRIISHEPLTVSVIEFWEQGEFKKSFDYKVAGSPCEMVVAGDFYNVVSNVKEKFKQSELLNHIEADSYIAVPISNGKRNPIGHFFLCDDSSLENRSWIENLLRLGALRMRLEIERLDAQEALREVNQNLELKVNERTKELSSANNELEVLRDKLQAENVYLKEEIKSNNNFEEIISENSKYQKVLKDVEKVAKTDSTVLIFGETGTGKEVLTRSIHSISARSNKPLVKVNCAALPATLIESELFGHEKGAYTGAVNAKQGRFELANEGTLFLDEVGEIPIELQSKLLRALQEGEFERVGGEKTIKVDVRVIAATNRNLEEAIKRGEFRADLFYRLNVFPIQVPPLRDRKDDIPLLIKHFINKFNQKLGNPVTKVPQSAIDQLMKYSWPGNVRELQNIIERGLIISEGKRLKIGNWLKGEIESDNDSFKSLSDFEKEYITKVLYSTNWKISGKNGAAEILEMKPTTLESRIKKLQIKREI